MTAPLDLDAIQTRLDAATPGPWWADDTEIHQGTPDDLNPDPTWIGETCNPDVTDHGIHNAAFIAAARTDVEQLLARVRELEAERARYVGVEPTIAEEMAELGRRLDAVDDVLTQQDDPSLCPDAVNLIADLRAALNGETAPSGPTQPA